jgi:hypothetical protein
MSEEKWHRLPADGIGFLIGKDANATVFSAHGKSICEGTLVLAVIIRLKAKSSSGVPAA